MKGELMRRGFSGDSRGELNVLLIPLIFVVLVLLGSLGFGVWAFNGREDYRLNTEEKIAVAVKDARMAEGIAKDKEFAEANKQPLKPYNGPDAAGSVKIMFPKSWSGYVSDASDSTPPLDGYFHPAIVPNATGRTSVFALRVKVVDQPYAKVVATFKGQVTSKKLTATPYTLPKMPKIVGVRFEGSIVNGKPITGSMVVLPIRDKTLQIWTESPQFAADFDNNILPNVTFSP